MLDKLRHAGRQGTVNKGADDYETPLHVLKVVLEGVPRNRIPWDPFFCKGNTSKVFERLGFCTAVHVDRDFFSYEPHLYDLIVTNPPFSIKKEVLTRLLWLGRPFAVLMPLSTVGTTYFYELFRARHYQVLIPRSRFNFLRADGKRNRKGSCCTFVTAWITVGFETFLGTCRQIIHVDALPQEKTNGLRRF